MIQYRNRAAAIIYSGDRILIHRREVDPFWAVPGGRIEAGESSGMTLKRELREELGFDIEEPRVPVCIAESYFRHDGREFQQISFYFRVNGRPLWEANKTDQDFRLTEPNLVFRWIKIDQLVSVDLRPSELMDIFRGEGPESAYRAFGFGSVDQK